MSQPMCVLLQRAGAIAALAGLLAYNSAAQAQSARSTGATPIGRIDFKSANLPPANVELDLSQSMFGDLFGIGDAAIAGVAEALNQSANGVDADATKMAAEQLAAIRKIIGLSSKVIHEVRIRAYEKLADDLSSRFDGQLQDGNWEKIAVLRKGDENARVFVINREGSIRGIFVVAGGKGGQVLVNVVCDMSPENVKQLTSAATKIGLENGLRQELEQKFRKMQRPKDAPQGSKAPPQPSKRGAA
jgi:hypothetical protein